MICLNFFCVEAFVAFQKKVIQVLLPDCHHHPLYFIVRLALVLGDLGVIKKKVVDHVDKNGNSSVLMLNFNTSLIFPLKFVTKTVSQTERPNYF